MQVSEALNISEGISVRHKATATLDPPPPPPTFYPSLHPVPLSCPLTPPALVPAPLSRSSQALSNLLTFQLPSPSAAWQHPHPDCCRSGSRRCCRASQQSPGHFVKCVHPSQRTVLPACCWPWALGDAGAVVWTFQGIRSDSNRSLIRHSCPIDLNDNCRPE